MKIVFIANPNEIAINALQDAGINVEIILRSGNVYDKVTQVNPDILICRNRDDISSLIKACSNIRMIFVVEVGLEKLPFSELQSHHIRVANTGGISADIMSNYVLGCILNHTVRLLEDWQNQQKSNWKRFQSTDSLIDKTLLIVGAGRTGIKIAQKAKAFGMRIIGIVRNQREIEGFEKVGTLDQMQQFISEADYVACTLPLTSETQLLFSKEVYRCMKPTAVFINVSRGGIVNESDLLYALDAGMLEHAYLDVFINEPLPKEHAFWMHGKVTVTPHQSGRLANNIEKAMKLFIQNYTAYCAGESMPNEVDLSKGY